MIRNGREYLESLRDGRVANLTDGMMGRSPDFIGGYVAGAAMQLEAIDSGSRPFAANLLAHYERCRREEGTF